MATKIKGITIEIGGETTKLDKALKQTNTQLKSTQSQLKDVERLLKLDPGNTELLAQKQRLLAETVTATRDRLSALQQAAQSADEALTRGKDYEAKYKPLNDEIAATSRTLDGLRDNQAQMEKALQSGELSAQQYEAFQQKITDTEGKLDSLKKAQKELEQEFAGAKIDQSQYDALQRELLQSERAAQDAERAFEDCADGMDEMNRKAKTVASGAGKIASGFAPVTAAVAALGAAAVATVPATEELRDDLSKLDTNAKSAGAGVDEVRGAMRRFYAISGEVDSSVEAVSNLLQAGFTKSNLQIALEGLAGAAIAFPDTLKVESLADGLQETLATGTAMGQFGELLDRVGIGAEHFSEMLALCPTAAEKQNAALSALAQGGMTDVYNGWLQENEALAKNRTATLEMQEGLADLAETIQPLVTQVTQLATSFLEWFNGLSVGGQRAIVTLLALVAAVGPVAGAISSVSAVLPKLIGLFSAADIKLVAITAAVAVLVGLAAKVAQSWDDMSGLERAVSILGLLTAAALTAAIAMGAFQSSISMGVAAVGIVAGIAAVVAAVNSATSRAKAAAASAQNMSAPRYATGTNYHTGGAALVGENGPELVSMPRGSRVYSAGDTRNLLGGQTAKVDVTLRVAAKDGLARDLSFAIDKADRIRGVKLVEGV